MIFNKILEKKKTVLIIFVAFLIIGIVIGFACKKEKYVASSIILLKSNDAKYSLTTGMFNTYKQIIKNDETYKEVEKVTGLGINYKDLSNSISISRENNSNTMNVKVKRYSEDESLKLLNAIINNFSEKLPEIYENEEVVIIDPSHISQKTNDANFLLAIPLSITCGMIISVIYVAVHLSIDKKQNILKDLERETLLKPLASIPFNKTKSNTLMSLESKTQKCFVPFDDLKTAIQFINFNKDSKKSVLVTSLLDGEGKSYVAANLAISYALAGKKVILIDADMDLGTQSSLFNVPNNLGFSNYLSNLNEEGIETEELLNKYIKETSIKNLNIITSGTVPPNSQELLFSDKITKLIKIVIATLIPFSIHGFSNNSFIFIISPI